MQDNVPIAAYVDALTNSLNPNSFVSASRISNGRAAIYLKTRDDIDEVVMDGISFNNSFIDVAPWFNQRHA